MKTKLSHAALTGLLLLIFLLFLSTDQSDNPEYSETSLISSSDSLLQVALELKSDRKYASALPIFREVAQQFENQQDWENYLISQRHLSFCYWITHQGDKALDLCTGMIEKGKEWLGPDHIEIAKLYTVMGNVHADRRTQKDFTKCVSYYEKALSITKNHYQGKHPAIADAYERLGIARYLIDDFAGAIPYYEKALTYLDEPSPENAISYGKTYNNLGLIYLGLGNMPKALRVFQNAKALTEKIQGPKDPVIVKYNLNSSHALTNLGEYGEALFLLDEAQALDAEVGEKGSKMKAYLLGSMGDVFLARGNIEVAIPYYIKCLDFWDPENRDNANGLIIENTKIGECYYKLGRTSKALEYFGKASALLEKYYDENNLTWVSTLINLGLTYQEFNDMNRARNYMEKALAIAQHNLGLQHPTISRIHTHLSGLHLKKDELKKALSQSQLARRALLIDTTKPISTDNLSSLTDYIKLLELTGLTKTRLFAHSGQLADLEEARALFQEGMNFSDSLKLNLHSGDALQVAQKQVFLMSEKALDCLYLLWQHTGKERYAIEAYEYFEKSKSDWLRASSREWLARKQAGIPEELIEKELTLKARLTYYQKLKNNCRIKPVPEHKYKLAVWQKQISSSKEELQELLGILEKTYPNYYQLKYDFSIAPASTVQNYLQKEEAGLITYFWGEESVYAMSITEDRIQWKKLVDRFTLQKEISALNQILNSPHSEWKKDEVKRRSFQTFCKSSRSLYSALVGQLLNDQKLRKTIIVPDGPLVHLPFQVLLDTEPNTELVQLMDYRNLPYLLQKQAIQYAYGASLLLKEKSSKNGHGYLGFSPSYSQVPSIAFSTRRGDNELNSYQFGELLYNKEEIEETLEIMGGDYYSGPTATEENFKKYAPKANILHLASHAYTEENNPDHSALVFAKDDQHPDDGILYAYELRHLPLQAELVVLSACNTGAGNILQGEGVMSLSRVFQSAGCPSVIMSLWSAHDKATKDIITEFFRNLNIGKKNKSAALQEAVKKYLSDVKDDAMTHPSYWANLVMIGNDDKFHSVDHPKLSNIWIALTIIGLLSIGFIGWKLIHYN